MATARARPRTSPPEFQPPSSVGSPVQPKRSFLGQRCPGAGHILLGPSPPCGIGRDCRDSWRRGDGARLFQHNSGGFSGGGKLLGHHGGAGMGDQPSKMRPPENWVSHECRSSPHRCTFGQPGDLQLGSSLR